MKKRLIGMTAAGVALLCVPAFAQDQPAEQTETAAAENCRQDLQAFGLQMEEDGYWLAGYRDAWGWRGYGVDPAAPAIDPAAPVATPGAAAPAAPWGAVGWDVSPGYQIRVLYSAAHVLAVRGEDDACQAVLAELRGLYDGYVTQLAEAGIEPGQVTGWRQERIAAATPVEELPMTTSVDMVIGTEVRNLQDEYLGSIEDVVLEPETGGVAFVVVSHGGFLGIGTNYAVVPWERLSVTPAFDVFVLDVPAASFENAPGIDPNRLSEPGAFEQTRLQFEQFWEQITPADQPDQQQ